MADVNPSGIAQLTRQLKSAATAGERNLSASEELAERLTELQEESVERIADLRSAVEDLHQECERSGEEAVGAVDELADVATTVGEDQLPTGAESLAESVSSTATSHDQNGARVEEAAESLTQEGFEPLAAALADAGETDGGTASTYAAAMSDLDAARDAAGEVVAEAASGGVEALETSGAGLEGEVLQGLESEASAGLGELTSAGGDVEQGAGRLEADLRQTYGEWVAASEGDLESLLESLVGSLEEVVERLSEAQESRLDRPCDQLLHAALPETQGDVESVASDGSEWNQEAQELSRTADEMDRAKTAKERFDRHIESAT